MRGCMSKFPRLPNELSSKEALALERQLKKKPNNVDARIDLLRYYLLRWSKKDRMARFEHIKWLVENAPTEYECGTPFAELFDEYSPQQFSMVREIWLSQIAANPENAQIYASAGQFVHWRDFHLGQELLKRAFELEANPFWAYSIVQFDWHEVMSDRPKLYKNNYAHDAIEYGERGLAADPSDYPSLKSMCLEHMAFSALYLGDTGTARSCAERHEKLKGRPQRWLQYSAAIYGLADLQEGKIESATKHLLFVEEGHYPRYSTLRLAQELLEIGQRDQVVEFLRKSQRFSDLREAAKWIREIQKGKTPNMEIYG